MKTHSVLTAIMCLTMASCEIVKIEADMPMSKTQSIEPSDDASFKVTPVNAGDLLEILYPGREISSIDYVAEGQDTLAYIYNFDKGWIVISGDKRGKPILGQSETGKLKAKGNVQGIDVWLKSSIGGICADSDDAKENTISGITLFLKAKGQRLKRQHEVGLMRQGIGYFVLTMKRHLPNRPTTLFRICSTQNGGKVILGITNVLLDMTRMTTKYYVLPDALQ